MKKIFLFILGLVVLAQVNAQTDGVSISNDPTDTPTSTLDIYGSVAKPIVFKGADYTATDADHTIIFYYPTGTGEVVLTLPEASTCKGRIYYIRTIETTNSDDRLVIAAHSGDQIDGMDTIEIGFQGLDLDGYQIVDAVALQSIGNGWMMISSTIHYPKDFVVVHDQKIIFPAVYPFDLDKTHNHNTLLTNGGTINLPQIKDVPSSGFNLDDLIYTIKLVAVGSATVTAYTGETIDGSLSPYSLSAQWEYVKIQSHGGSWYIIGQN